MRWKAKDAMSASARLVLSDSAGIGYSPQEFARLAMGCSYNGMKMSVVFVSGAQTWHKIKTGAAGGAIFHSPHRAQRTSGAYASCCCPRPWFAVFFIENVAWFEVTGPEKKWRVSHDPARSTDGVLVRTHFGALSTVSCPSLACRSARQCMTYMF